MRAHPILRIERKKERKIFLETAEGFMRPIRFGNIAVRVDDKKIQIMLCDR